MEMRKSPKNYVKLVRLGLLWATCLALSLTASAQSAVSVADATSVPAGKASTRSIDSKLMGREMPYNLLLPEEYGSESSKQVRYPVIYLLHGLTGHFDDWATKTRLPMYSQTCECIIVMPEGNNGWYTDSATVSADKYESYIVQELIPEIDKTYRTNAERGGRAIAGLSMGGYGAIKFGMKFPELFFLAGSFSGALGVTDVTDKNSSAWVSNSVMSVFGDAENQHRGWWVKNKDPIHRVMWPPPPPHSSPTWRYNRTDFPKA